MHSPIPIQPRPTPSISSRPPCSRSKTTTRVRRDRSSSRTRAIRGTGSLRQAIINADAATSPSDILFDIPAATDPALHPRARLRPLDPDLDHHAQQPSTRDHPDGLDRWVLRGRIREFRSATPPDQLGRADGRAHRHSHRRDIHARAPQHCAAAPQGTTGPIAYNATPAQVQAALVAMLTALNSNLAGSVAVTGLAWVLYRHLPGGSRRATDPQPDRQRQRPGRHVPGDTGRDADSGRHCPWRPDHDHVGPQHGGGDEMATMHTPG